MAVYDTQKIKQVAKMIDQVADLMDAEVKAEIRNTAECIEMLRGKTAQAIDERRQQLIHKASSLSLDLDELAHHINTYARMLKEADMLLAEKL
ncbi:MAG: hypothetical protein IJC48_06120 [Clostridia bacterium]|nr:hypothetical protein [Clostridia bacterium]MBQ4159001.1 hypothetical protein [Clostridia bacterium]